jgi:hypothetical protein
MLHLVALVIFFNGASDGGRAINAELRFNTLRECEVARDRIILHRPSSSIGMWSPTAICIEQVRG